MSQQKIVTSVILDLFEDNKPHSIKEVQEAVEKRGLKLSRNSTVVRSILSKMCRDKNIQNIQRGIYASLGYRNSTIRELDLEQNSPKFITVTPPAGRYSLLAVTILENGHVNLNGKLNAAISSRNITLQFTPTFKQIKLIAEGQSPHRFTKAGTTVNFEIRDLLKKHRVSLPARYIMYTVEEEKIYTGNLDVDYHPRHSASSINPPPK